jgi:hypothetical protein
LPVRRSTSRSRRRSSSSRVWPGLRQEQAQRYPTDLGAQYGIDEFIDDARRDYAGHAALQAAFDRIERSLDG